MISEEQIKGNDNISTDVIKTDIADTEKEIKDYSDELNVLMRNPQQNKVRIYFLNGSISSRKEFINYLNEILSCIWL